MLSNIIMLIMIIIMQTSNYDASCGIKEKIPVGNTENVIRIFRVVKLSIMPLQHQCTAPKRDTIGQALLAT